MLGIDANWDPSNNAAEFSVASMNQILTESYMDDFDFWQQMFGIFSTMRLNQDKNFTVSHIRENALLIQPHKACDWTPAGGLTFDHKEYTPCKAKINTEQCYDELFDSCYKHFLQWNEAQPIRFSEGEGMRFFNLLMQAMMRSAVQGIRLTCTLGKFFDFDKVKSEFNEKVSTDIRKLFKQTIANKETCAGYLYLIRELGKSKDNAKIDFSKCVDFTKKGIQGNIEDVIEKIECNIPYDLEQIYRSGGNEYMDASGRMRVIQPIFFATADWMRFIQNEYKKQDNDASLLLNRERCITMQRYQYGAVTKKVYYINDVPVYPLTDSMHATKYMNGDISAFFLTTTGNIAFGGSFNNIKSQRNPNMGLRVQMKEDNENYGKYSVLGHMLIKNTILNHELIAGCVEYRGAEA